MDANVVTVLFLHVLFLKKSFQRAPKYFYLKGVSLKAWQI